VSTRHGHVANPMVSLNWTVRTRAIVRAPPRSRGTRRRALFATPLFVAGSLAVSTAASAAARSRARRAAAARWRSIDSAEQLRPSQAIACGGISSPVAPTRRFVRGSRRLHYPAGDQAEPVNADRRQWGRRLSGRFRTSAIVRPGRIPPCLGPQWARSTWLPHACCGSEAVATASRQEQPPRRCRNRCSFWAIATTPRICRTADCLQARPSLCVGIDRFESRTASAFVG
jgi:hypothetical protein